MRHFLSHPQRTSARGFTLLEALVAVTILVLAVAGPFYAATIVLNNVLLATDRTTASYLAQEGIEYIHMMRDNTFLNEVVTQNPDAGTPLYFPNDFLGGSGPNSVSTCLGNQDGTTFCALDPTLSTGTGSGQALQVCAKSYCSDMPLYPSANGYVLTSNGSTPVFTRAIQLYYPEGDSNGVEIVSTVSWSEHGIPYKVAVTDYLYPWQ